MMVTQVGVVDMMMGVPAGFWNADWIPGGNNAAVITIGQVGDDIRR